MGEASEPVGSVEVALAHATRLLESNPVLAAEQASEILKAVPAHPVATLLLGVARRTAGDAAAAADALSPLVAMHPQWALAHYELALALSGLEIVTMSAVPQSKMARRPLTSWARPFSGCPCSARLSESDTGVIPLPGALLAVAAAICRLTTG